MTPKITFGYTLWDRETGKILKYGQTTNPKGRYSEGFYNKHSARMHMETSGTKKEMVQWEKHKIEEFLIMKGHLPELNKTNR